MTNSFLLVTSCFLGLFVLFVPNWRCDPLIVRFTLAVLPRWWALVLPWPPGTWAPPAHPIHRAAHRSHGAGYEWWGIQSPALPSRPKGGSLGHVAGVASKLRGCRGHDCASVSTSFNKFIQIHTNSYKFKIIGCFLGVLCIATYSELQVWKFWNNTCNLTCKLYQVVNICQLHGLSNCLRPTSVYSYVCWLKIPQVFKMMTGNQPSLSHPHSAPASFPSHLQLSHNHHNPSCLKVWVWVKTIPPPPKKIRYLMALDPKNHLPFVGATMSWPIPSGFRGPDMTRSWIHRTLPTFFW